MCVALGRGSSWATKALGSRMNSSPSHVVFCFQITRINKLIISVLVLMGFSLLTTSNNVLVTFIIFRDTLCGTLRQGQQEFLCSFIQLFIFLSVFLGGFYVVEFFFLLLTYVSVLFLPTLSPCFLLLLVISLFLSNTFHALFSSPSSACTHESRKVQDSFGSSYSCVLHTYSQIFSLSFHTYERCEGRKETGLGKCVTGHCCCWLIQCSLSNHWW